ncbi:hypothetical protein CIPAW_01G020200 [Carya illinoinensis]|uniref:Uncharacterized protein n=1 Tax=Carya illinoinensis TaxID=32201 RepID=A0A8T1RKB9_CARIL|nr:hypothetical protein CIPAW_01G020200 [Carya illinoinensis]
MLISKWVAQLLFFRQAYAQLGIFLVLLASSVLVITWLKLRGPVLRSKMHEFVGEEKNDDP